MKDVFSLEGRVALVTGGSRGIGRMIAEGFLHQGAKVYITARKAEACDEAAAELSALGECVSLPADVSSVAGARKLAGHFAARESRLDILVHNAGAVWVAPFTEFTESGWDRAADLNMKTPFFLTQALHAHLATAGKSRCAKVINIASIDGITVNPQETYSYAASKAGLVHLTRRLVADNIVVSCIAPGAFPSDMNREARDRPEESAGRIPARRVGNPDDIAAAAVYLASRAGDYVVGETLVVDGGWSMSRG